MPIYSPSRYPPQGQINLTGTPHTILPSWLYQLVTLSHGSGIVLNVPSDANLNFPVNGFVDFIQIGTGQVTITPVGTTVNGAPGLLFFDQWSAVSLVKRAPDTWVAIGRLST